MRSSSKSTREEQTIVIVVVVVMRNEKKTKEPRQEKRVIGAVFPPDDHKTSMEDTGSIISSSRKAWAAAAKRERSYPQTRPKAISSYIYSAELLFSKGKFPHFDRKFEAVKAGRKGRIRLLLLLVWGRGVDATTKDSTRRMRARRQRLPSQKFRQGTSSQAKLLSTARELNTSIDYSSRVEYLRPRKRSEIRSSK